ncbi:type I restriction endonuclease subunit R [Gallibacterium melopsittaci]|uniref:Type I restriction enzyme endonuclease subunit n=1 Tax=Gallibacterium melopsittaci TaxID=516063 RepID=A0ABV6HYI3_9PAST
MKLGINESVIEQQAIDTLQNLGWQYAYGKEILADCQYPWRENSQEVILSPLLHDAIAKLNPQLPPDSIDEVVKTIRHFEQNYLAERNKQFYGYLKQGVPVRYIAPTGEEKVEYARLIDFQHTENNHWLAVNQFEITGKRGKRIPDLICFINGLPLIVFEFKNPLDVQADLQKAFNQLQTYQQDIADLFIYNQLQIISDGTTARAGSLTADFARFMPWKVVDEKQQSQRIDFSDELSGLLNGLMLPENILDYIHYFITFETNTKGMVIKKSAAYHQFYGVNEAVECTIAAHEQHSQKIGVVWHTQGSGKSLSMLFYAGKLMSQAELQNPTIVVVTDRNDLDGQLFATFSTGKEIIRQEPIQADGREALRQELAKRESGGVIFTTIQKFALVEGESRHPALNDRHNIIVISDEAHRSQYGFNAKLNEHGEYRVGYAKHLRDALPNASFIGFTGTPISLDDKDTQEVFGRYVSIYDIHDAVEDGATVPIIYEARQITLSESKEYQQAIAEAQNLIDEDKNSYNFRLREQLMGADSRLEKLAKDLVQHFATRTQLADGKAMVVVMSRRICVKLYNEIIKLRPDWHSDDIHQGAIKIVMTGSASDPEEMQPHIYSSEQKKELEKRFKNPDDPLKMVIVRDMWLTGFDAPCCHTMYIDKPMQGHNLMQAIARVNRVFKNKSRDNGGLIVDYVGLTEELRQATKQYTNAGGKSDVKIDIDTVFDKMCEYVAIIRDQMRTPVDGKIIDIAKALALTEPQEILTLIRQAASHILGLDRIAPPPQHGKDQTPRKNAFLQAIRQAKKGLSLCGSLPQVEPYRQELAFYDAVRATIVKPENDGNHSAKERQLQLLKLLNRAIQSDGVVDLFDLLEQERPNINLLSDEFLGIIDKSDSKDLWLVSIEGYLKGQIRDRAARNLATQKRFEEKLKQAMNQYHNHNLTVMEIITELVEMAKALQAELSKGEQLGLNAAEMAFYDALAQNQSAVELMGDKVLVNLAQEVTKTLRKSISIDWQHKESVRAKMRVLIRRVLLKYKYPPDLQSAAIEFVLQQAEVVADELSSEGDR